MKENQIPSLDFFYEIKEGNNAICKICKLPFAHKGGGNNTLKRHVMIKHPDS